ncbi:MAG: ECF-type sigma factor [Proteobacteria bacterium]|nr:ECF-type sigma factor [Pseudomonadota bacterium]
MDPVDRLIAATPLGAPTRAPIVLAWDAFVDSARAAWPTLTFDLDHLATFVGERLVGDDLAQALALAPAADLALAAACVAQDPRAHAAFDDVLVEVELAGSVTRAPNDLVDEVKQLLRVQLLVPTQDRPAALVGYRGKGPLRGWLRITATRELIRHQKKRDREVAVDDTGMLDALLGARGGPGDADPLMSQLKAQYRSEFALALREAIEQLEAEDRTLLRQQLVDGLSIDELGAAFGVHRATAARWLTRARAALVALTHDRLAARLRVPVDEIASVIRLVQSRLDASMVRFLEES